jgi:hypothetical protein
LGTSNIGAKTTNASQNTWAHGFFGKGLDALDQGITRFNVYALLICM